MLEGNGAGPLQEGWWGGFGSEGRAGGEGGFGGEGRAGGEVRRG